MTQSASEKSKGFSLNPKVQKARNPVWISRFLNCTDGEKICRSAKVDFGASIKSVCVWRASENSGALVDGGGVNSVNAVPGHDPRLYLPAAGPKGKKEIFRMKPLCVLLGVRRTTPENSRGADRYISPQESEGCLSFHSSDLDFFYEK